MVTKAQELAKVKNNTNTQLGKVSQIVNELLSTELTSDNVKKLNVKQLRALIKYHNLHSSIRGYSKMKKPELILNIAPFLKDLNDKFEQRKAVAPAQPAPAQPAAEQPKPAPKKAPKKKATKPKEPEPEPVVPEQPKGPEKKPGLTEKAVLNNYIKPEPTIHYTFKKMAKDEQNTIISKIQLLVAENKPVNMVVKDKKVMVEEPKARKKGKGMKSANIQKFIEATYNATPDEIQGYKLDKALSTRHTKVYYNSELNKGVISERPTTDLADVITDIYAGFDLMGSFKHPRFKNSWATFDKVEKKYGSFKNWVLIGYSLGAIVAEHYKKANEFAELFLVAKPVLPHDVITRRKPLKNATEIRGNRDIVSLFKPFQEKAEREVVVDTKTMNPIKSHQQKNVFKQIDKEKELGDEQNKTGLGRKQLRKMKVRELKVFAKKLGKARKQKVLIGGKRRTELQDMIIQLSI